jgi:hypothetical protein
MIILDQIVDGDGALMLLIGGAATDRIFVERDRDKFLLFARRHRISLRAG